MLGRIYQPSSLIAFILLTTTIHGSISTNMTCQYWESIDLTEYKSFPNGSYVFNKTTIIPKELVSNYNYKLKEKPFQNITVDPYPRGCICNLIPCVRFCCESNKKYNTFTKDCVPVEGSSKKEDTFSKFHIIVHEFKCEVGFYLDPYIHEDYNSSLSENGSVLWHSQNFYMGMDRYCLSPYYLNGSHQILPVLCSEGEAQVEVDATDTINSIAMLVSVFFMIATIAVYICVPELRTLHGKSLCCYLLDLCVGYSIIGSFAFTPLRTDWICSTLGYLAYFSFMASFFWLTVMNFDIYYKMGRPRKEYNEKKSFILYSAYSWGLAFICLLLIYFAQISSWIPDEWKADIGVDLCFLNTEKLSIYIFYFGPLILITGFNWVMFVLTVKLIYQIKKNMSNIVVDNKIKTSQENINNAFGIFFRLFIVMGINWSLEILAHIYGEHFPLVTKLWNFFNGIQGLVIFCLLVIKKRIWKYMLKSFQKREAFKGTFLARKEVDTNMNLETISSSTRQVEMEEHKKDAEPLVLEG